MVWGEVNGFSNRGVGGGNLCFHLALFAWVDGFVTESGEGLVLQCSSEDDDYMLCAKPRRPLLGEAANSQTL